MIRFVYFLFFTFLFIQSGSFAQEVDLSSKIDRYYALSDEKQYEQSAKIAYEIGQVYLGVKQYDFAKKFFEFAVNDSKRADLTGLNAQSYYYAGLSTFYYAETIQEQSKREDQYDEAANYFKESNKYFGKSKLNKSELHVLSGYYYGICRYKLDEIDIKEDRNDAIKALNYALENAHQYNTEIAKESARLLAKIYALEDYQSKADYYQSVYQTYIDHESAVDSLKLTKQTNENLAEETDKIRSDLGTKIQELNEQQTINELQKENIRQQKELIIYVSSGAGVIMVLLLFIFRAYRFTKRAKRELEAKNVEILKQKQLVEERQKALEKEKAKSERLLLNVLPRSVAIELREHGRTRPLFYKQVTVVFTDFKGFTRFAEKMSPAEIVKELDVCFHAFDNIVEKHNLEKIKTMGDGYLCAGGVPKVNKSNPYDAIKAAMEMMAFMQKRKEEKRREGKDYFELRIGIHTGPVVAGVVGKKKFAYDIWGDTVNVASRMESSGEAGKINISGDTFAYVKDQFFFTHRGKIQAKNKGEIDMFFVDGRVKYAVKG